jgi:hypothetical protein
VFALETLSVAFLYLLIFMYAALPIAEYYHRLHCARTLLKLINGKGTCLVHRQTGTVEEHKGQDGFQSIHGGGHLGEVRVEVGKVWDGVTRVGLHHPCNVKAWGMLTRTM